VLENPASASCTDITPVKNNAKSEHTATKSERNFGIAKHTVVVSKIKKTNSMSPNIKIVNTSSREIYSEAIVDFRKMKLAIMFMVLFDMCPAAPVFVTPDMSQVKRRYNDVITWADIYSESPLLM